MDKENCAKIMEYLDLLDDFSDWVQHTEAGKSAKKELLMRLVSLENKAAGIDEDETAIRLYHLAGGYRQAEYFFGTENTKAAMPMISDDTKLIVMMSHELSRTGAPVVFADAARILKEAGYYVVVFSPMDGPLRKEICDMGIPVIIDHALLYGRCEQAELREVHQYQRWETDFFADCADMLFLNTAVMHNAVERYMGLGQPMIWWMHEGNVSFESFGDCMPKSLPDHVKVVYVSDYVREQLEASGISYPGSVMHYGVADFACAPAETSEYFNFVMVGAVSRRKGQDLLLDAINRLPRNYLDRCRFYFVGSAAEPALYNRIEMLSRGCDYIKLCKAMPREELLRFYQSCDCIICASRDDPLPVVLTEMMILSRPSICSDHTGTASYIEDGKEGFLFPNEDVDALVQAICKCADSGEQVKEMGKAARRLYEAQFGMDVFESNLKSLIEKELETAVSNKG